MAVTVLVAASICVLAAFLWRRMFTRKKTPPGPWGLPLFGYLPFLSKMPHLDLQRLGKKYGKVFSIRLGSRYLIVFNDFKSSKEAFAQDAFMGRPAEFPLDLNKETIETGAFLDYPWKNIRRFSIHMFKDLGLGKSEMEEHIREEISDLLKQLERNIDQPFCTRSIMAESMSNNMAALIFGKRFSFDDPVRRMLIKTLNELATSSTQTAVELFFPWLSNIFKFLNIDGVERNAKKLANVKLYAWKEIEEHEETLNPGDIRDYIDGFLMEIEKKKDVPTFNKKVLQDMATIFFLVGTETVRTTIEWSLLIVASYPDVQRRIQAEIDEIIGSDRFPVGLDEKNMPYTEAFIMEVMRWRTVFPLSVFKYTLSDTEVNGFYIPKHTLIMSNLWAIHHDPNYWGSDAEEFRPERFLTEEGKTLKKVDQFMPFSIGKRACPGESLAKLEVFLYLVSILQKFNLRLPQGKVADFEGELGGSLAPKIQHIILKKRN